VFLIPNETIAMILFDAEVDIKRGLENVHRRKGIEDGMRQVNRGLGSINTIKRLIEKQSTVDVNVSIKK
jgi:hypothetical protein